MKFNLSWDSPSVVDFDVMVGNGQDPDALLQTSSEEEESSDEGLS